MTTFEKVQDIIAEQLGIDKKKITETSDIMKDLQADSLEVAEMMFLLEENFKVSLDEEEALALKTPADIVALIDKLSK